MKDLIIVNRICIVLLSIMLGGMSLAAAKPSLLETALSEEQTVWICTVSAVIYILIYSIVSQILLRKAHKMGLCEGKGNPQEPHNVLKQHDVVQILKCYETMASCLCLVEAKDAITYVRIEKSLQGYPHLHERRFYRIRYGNDNKIELSDLHQEIARLK